MKLPDQIANVLLSYLIPCLVDKEDKSGCFHISLSFYYDEESQDFLVSTVNEATVMTPSKAVEILKPTVKEDRTFDLLGE